MPFSSATSGSDRSRPLPDSSPMRESHLLRHIEARSAHLPRDFRHVLVGPGDDCAIVDLGQGPAALTTDHLVEGRHFEAAGLQPTHAAVNLIARKAIARSVSDIAAMGAEPVCALATACLPVGFEQGSADALFDAMHRWASHWRCPLVGGDIASFSGAHPGPLVLTTTVIGRAPASGGVLALRSTATPGQGVYVTGVLGGSLRSGWHAGFEPRLAEAQALTTMRAGDGSRPLGAMMDLSDGLGRDGSRMGRASNVLLEIDASRLPLRAGADWRAAVSEGEDYELLFTFDDRSAPTELRSSSNPALSVSVTKIGTVLPPADKQDDSLPATGCIIRVPEGADCGIDGDNLGWEHT